MFCYERARLVPFILIIFISSLVFTKLSSAQEGEPSQLKARVRLVEVTLQAQDGHGHHVTDLKQGELKIIAGGRERELRVFIPQQVSLGRFSNVKALNVEYRDFDAMVPPEPRYYVILMHQLQYEFGFFQPARAAVREFIEKRMLPTDRVALVCFDKYVDLELDFTGDKQLLLDTVDSLHLKFRNVDMVDRYYGYLTGLAHRVAGMPHKVTIILVAAGMFGVRGQGCYEDYQSAIDALQAADVRVYGVDTRGLSFKEPGTSVASLPVEVIDLVKQGFNLGLYSGPTGGKTFRYHNNILSLLERVDYEMSASYVLGFYLEENEVGKRLDIEIECARPGVNLHYKSEVRSSLAN
jgi:VWFA-related protein